MFIKPTVGRIVWFYAENSGDEPFAAIITRVHADDAQRSA